MKTQTIHTAPPNTGEAVLGKTLPELMYDACAQYTNPQALNQPTNGDWRPFSLNAFRQQAEETALGLLDLGLQQGDHVAFFMESDVYFCIADMGCLLAGIVDVPIYLSSAPEAVTFILEHSEAKAIFVSNLELLNELTGILPQTPGVQHIIVAEMDDGTSVPALPERVDLLSLDEVQERGRQQNIDHDEAIQQLRDQIQPDDLATIIYTSGTTGQPKGVLLTHENISYNAMTAFSGLKGYVPGPDKEIAISFLPLTHIFARALHYGSVAYGTSVYFTTPQDLVADLTKIRPTTFATVPRVLEKVYSRIEERIDNMTGVQKAIGKWALGIAGEYELGETPGPLQTIKLALADKLVFKKWRAALGGRVRFVIAGGAALNGKLANVFGAADIPIYQGYGLTETSPVITYNRPGRNRAGTVGEPLPGLEVAIAEDGEILTRGPHVMKGYYKAPDKTSEVLNDDGWFHTGDIGEFTAEGFLRITDRKKDLFKLSTGKYVMPQPLENRLGIESMIEHAVVVGAGHKFCTALIFPDEETLRSFARSAGLNAEQPINDLLASPPVIDKYQDLVDQANQGMDHWSTIKSFVLIPGHLTIENGLLTPTLKVKRSKVCAAYEDEIAALYDEKKGQHKGVLVA
ncbi:MAG TPA: long-chain fatty acid--CoA ligase [Rhodothermales bacterium]|nr:long-chain fatty acid--CoA ligase [Rhodothermales bacterium]